MEGSTKPFDLAFEMICDGRIDQLNDLLEMHPSVVAERDGRGLTLLHLAAAHSNDRVDIIELLLLRGSDIHALDIDGSTAAEYADLITNLKVWDFFCEQMGLSKYSGQPIDT